MILVLVCCFGFEELRPSTVVAKIGEREVSAKELVTLQATPQLNEWKAGHVSASPELSKLILTQLEPFVEELALIAYARKSLDEKSYQAVADKAKQEIQKRLKPSLPAAAKERMVQRHLAQRILSNMLSQTVKAPTESELQACFESGFKGRDFAPNAQVTVLEFPTDNERVSNQSRKAAKVLQLVVQAGEPFAEVASNLPKSVRTQSADISELDVPSEVSQHASFATENSVTLVVSDRRLFAIHVDERNSLRPLTETDIGELVRKRCVNDKKKAASRELLKTIRARMKVTMLRNSTGGSARTVSHTKAPEAPRR